MSAEDGMLGGRYRMDSLLGQGGMAQVYGGTDTVLGRSVAIKILAPQYAKDPSFVERFRREAQSAARLNHPNVVGVYDTGSDDGTHYIVMEFVEGRTLADFLASGGRLLPERAVELAGAVCVALAEAHRAGIVHRDIKPGNIMVTRAGEVKVMDFGIARAASAETVTATATVLGTASYLSPEQAQGQPVDARSDIYSLGVVLYEMITGRVPFAGDSAVAVAYKHVQEPPKPPSQLNPDVSPPLEAVVMRALAKNPDNRYQTAQEFCQDLERLRQGAPVSATPLLPMAETQVVSGNPVTATRVQRPTSMLPPEERRRKRWPWILAAFLVLFGILVALFFIGKNLLTENANQVAVPKLTGRTLADAESKLKDANLQWHIQHRVDTTVRPDTVLSQSPASGSKVNERSFVTLVVSKGEPTVAVPDLTTGMTKDQAKTALEAAGFTLGNVSRQSSNTVPAGQVISQNPAAGTQTAKGTAVDIVISSGQQLVTVPDLTCHPLGRAESELRGLGLTLVQSGNTSFVDACPHSGRVASQTPSAGAQVRPGTNVTVDETEDKTPSPSPSA